MRLVSQRLEVGPEWTPLTVIIVCLSTGLCWATSTVAQTVIYKCTDASGSVVYSQLPCTAQKAVDAVTAEADEKSAGTKSDPAERELPAAENAVGPADRKIPVAENEQERSEVASDIEECKKRYRDQIDAIDAEIGQEYTPEKGEQYKQRLLVLTRKLRQC